MSTLRDVQFSLPQNGLDPGHLPPKLALLLWVLHLLSREAHLEPEEVVPSLYVAPLQLLIGQYA